MNGTNEFTEHDDNRTVSEFLEESFSWRWNWVSPILSTSNIFKLSNTILDPISMERDTMHWLQLEGKFSVNSTYELDVRSLNEGHWKDENGYGNYEYNNVLKFLFGC